MEVAPTEDLFSNPIHPYTQALLSATPLPDPISERSKRIRFFDPKLVAADGEMREISPRHFIRAPISMQPEALAGAE
jgi:ABC-type oligopeptide transport system ATPase subunit